MKNSRKFLAIAAIAAASFAGAASAATQSPESWVGPEPVAQGPALSRAQVQADLALWNRAAMGQAAQSPESWVGPEPEAKGPALSRAEVQADLNLWNRAGMGQYSVGESSYVGDANYTAHLAEYRHLRSGPAYQAELRRLGGEVSAVATQAAAPTAH